MKKTIMLITKTDLVEYRFISLLDSKYDLIISSSEQDVITKLNYRNNKIDLFILDLDINEKVFSLIEQIKERKITKPIIVLSNQNDKKHFIRAIKLGIDDYIIKPFEDKRMEMTLNKYLETDFIPLRNEVINYKEDILLEIKKSKKGSYPVTFIVFRFIGRNKLYLTNAFMKMIRTKIWDTDKVLFYTKHSIIMILPFSGIENINLIEEKMKFYYSEIIKDKKTFDDTGMISLKKIYPNDVLDFENLIFEIDQFVKE